MKKELDLTFVKMVQEKKEIERRNARARKYSRSISESKFKRFWRKHGDVIIMSLDALSIFVILYGMYIILNLFA